MNHNIFCLEVEVNFNLPIFKNTVNLIVRCNRYFVLEVRGTQGLIKKSHFTQFSKYKKSFQPLGQRFAFNLCKS